MRTEQGQIEKRNDEIIIKCDGNNHYYIVDTIQTENIPGKNLNIAIGRCRNPKGKKSFGFCVKNNGVVLISII